MGAQNLFTGSFRSASIWRRSQQRMKRTTMELGGHSPVVVFADSIPKKAADTIAAFKSSQWGSLQPTRFYVQEVS
jgi:succinate-semialdehyde dehydrogenase/glutarate-semialdehyde dehydrogenase